MPQRMETLVVGPFMENCYLYYDDGSAKALIIDPGDEASRISEVVSKLKIEPIAILLTHGHVDHIGAVEELRAEYDIPLILGKGEEILLADPSANGSAAYGHPITVLPADRIVDDEELLVLSGLTLRVLATPGHSPGSVSYLDETNGWLFCGDTLFQQSIGRTDLYGGSLQTLMDSISKKILSLPDKVVCYPGHGPATTVGAERQGNPFLIGGYFA